MGWESAQDANGKTYYFNRGTGETSWKKPAEMEVEIQVGGCRGRRLQANSTSIRALTPQNA